MQTPPEIPKGKRRNISSPVSLVNTASAGLFIAMLLLLFIPLFMWFGCRIEPRANQIAVLIRKTGENLSDGQVIALKEEQKGIQLDVLPEGRYFRNPYTWGWKIHKIVDISAGRLGVVTRLYGTALSHDKIIAEEGTKGILKEVLKPGKYRVNPYANYVQEFSAVTIRPGHVGVVTSLTGSDVLTSDMPEEARNTFLVREDDKGVKSDVLDPGTYYLNPYMLNVVEVNLQSQRFSMSGKDVIAFLTMDGFTVTVEGTIEYAIARDKAALISHRVGNMDDIIMKVILPRARGFSRIEGSKHPAIDYIVGETRQAFQNILEEDLRARSEDWGVDIKSVLIRKIIVPDEIASISRDREIAVQDAKKFTQQLDQARSEAELVKQEMLAEQKKAKVKADTSRITAVIDAERDQEVNVIAANKDLEVARLHLGAAQFQAQAIVLEAEGEKDSIEANNIAEASVLADKVSAFGDGINYSRYIFYQKIGPQVDSILSSDNEDGLGAVFTPFFPTGKGVSK